MGPMRCAGILLTGGASRRMGRDKATVAWGSTTLAGRAGLALSAVVDPVVELGPGMTGLPVRHDDPPGRGPLCALADGLAALGRPGDDVAAPFDAVLVLACDLPLVEAGLLAWLRDHPAPGSVVPLAGEPTRPQPLCARWAWADLALAPALVADGARSLRPLLASTGLTLVPPPVWAPHAGPAGAGALDDADTPAELSRLRRLAGDLAAGGPR